MDKVIAALTPASLIALGKLSFSWARAKMDRRAVHACVQATTRDAPLESHLDTATLAKRTCLPDDRVQDACVTDGRIHRHRAPGQPDLWSVWRSAPQEPPSVYESRGLLIL